MWTGIVTDGGGNCSRLMAATDLDRDYQVLGYRPFPGSLNLNVRPDVFGQVAALPSVEAVEETYWPVRVGDVDCHAKRWRNQFELVAPFKLRDHLGLANGDTVTFTPRVSVSVAVMAHQKRRQWAEQLAEQLGCPVVWDRRSNVWDTARRAWLAHNPNATHHLVIQDDAIVCDDLRVQAERIAAAAPAVPVALTCIGYRIKHDRSGYDQARRWWPTVRGVSTVALMLPTADIPDMIAACDRSGSRHDDVRIMGWYRNQSRPIWMVKPSLVAHRTDNNPTLVDGNDRWADRSTLNFVPVAGDIDWTEGAPMATRDGYATFVHRKTGKPTTVKVGTAGHAALSRLAHNGNVWRQIDAPTPEPEPVEVVPDFQPADVSPPAKAGPGSSRDAWATFATVHGVTVEEHMTRDDLVGACERAGVV